MRLRKLHAIVAVSVALVLVARSIDARRRDREGTSPEPVGEVPHDPQVGAWPNAPTEDESPPRIDADAFASAGLSTLDQAAAGLDASPDAEQSTVEVGAVTPEEPAALMAELVAAEPATPVSPATEPDVSERRRWVPRRPVAIVATVMVLMALLAGAIAAAAGAASAIGASHPGAARSLHR
jgi:hypothetical protein